MIVFGQKLLYSGKSGCTRAKLFLLWLKHDVFDQSGCIREKVVVIEQYGCIWAKVVVFGQKWFYSVKSDSIWAK